MSLSLSERKSIRDVIAGLDATIDVTIDGDAMKALKLIKSCIDELEKMLMQPMEDEDTDYTEVEL